MKSRTVDFSVHNIYTDSKMSYRLTMTDTGEKLVDGHGIVHYKFESTAPDQVTIFEGSDYFPSPLNRPLSDKSVNDLMGFLTLKQGDTDSEYFKDYNITQMLFRDAEAEFVSYAVYDMFPEFN